jgi:hypothetical protein
MTTTERFDTKFGRRLTVQEVEDIMDEINVRYPSLGISQYGADEIDEFDDVDYDEFDPREYSGRFMFGEKCGAFQIDRNASLPLVSAAVHEIAKEMGLPVPIETDNLGFDLLLY